MECRKLIAKETLKRGFYVTAIVRGENKSATKKALLKNPFDLTKGALAEFGIVVDACCDWIPQTISAIPWAAKNLETCWRDVRSAFGLWAEPEAFT